jgi:hypothetical protein
MPLISRENSGACMGHVCHSPLISVSVTLIQTISRRGVIKEDIEWGGIH